MYSEVHEHVPKLPGSDLDVPGTLWNLGFDSISLCFQEWMIRFLLNYSSNNWIFQSSSIATNNVWNSGYYAESCKYWFILRMFLDFPLLQSRMFTQGIFSLEAGQILLKSNLFFFRWGRRGRNIFICLVMWPHKIVLWQGELKIIPWCFNCKKIKYTHNIYEHTP